jgi:hypothetical protein
MPHEQKQPSPEVLTLRPNQPLAAIIVEENGQRVVKYFAADGPRPVPSGETLRAALAAIGSSSDIDWDEWAEQLDRIRHESRPTPPIELDE